MCGSAACRPRSSSWRSIPRRTRGSSNGLRTVFIRRCVQFPKIHASSRAFGASWEASVCIVLCSIVKPTPATPQAATAINLDDNHQVGVDHWAIGTKRVGGAEGTWRDAEDGVLGRNATAKGG